MHLIRYRHKKFVFLALVAAIALSLCPVEHLVPVASASAHSEEAVSECMPDVCATLESKKLVSHEKTVQAKLFFVPEAPFIPFQFQNGDKRFRFNQDSAPPPLNKLYHLHATYLI